MAPPDGRGLDAGGELWPPEQPGWRRKVRDSRQGCSQGYGSVRHEHAPPRRTPDRRQWREPSQHGKLPGVYRGLDRHVNRNVDAWHLPDWYTSPVRTRVVTGSRLGERVRSYWAEDLSDGDRPDVPRHRTGELRVGVHLVSVA